MKSYAKTPILLVTLLVLLAATASIAAQDLNDPGITEPYHPGLVHFRVGVFYQLRGDHERAIAEFTATIDGLPRFDAAYAARGDSYAALGKFAEALGDFGQALAVSPTSVSVLYTRGRVYMALGQTDLAETDFANAVGQMPSYALPYFGLGDVAFERGDFGEALAAYEAYVSRANHTPDALVLQRIDLLEMMAAAGML